MEEVQNRKREQQPPEVSDRPVRPTPVRRPASPTGPVQRPSRRESSSVESVQNELERLLREARERKRQPQPPSRPPVRLPEREHVRVQSRSAEVVKMPPPPPPQPRRAVRPLPVEPPYAVQPYRVERERVARPERPVRVEPDQPSPKPRRRTDVRRMTKRVASKSVLGQPSLAEIRKGIILSEILGTPKGLEGLDSPRI